MKILVVEDQPTDLKLAVEVLRAAGHQVDHADAAPRARAAIERQRPDVILMDLSLPETDGLAIARDLKADPATRAIHIVAITSYPDDFSRSEALAAGCDAYLAKPVDTRALPGILTGVVESARRIPEP
ncbi:MAG TPA: response regulator [Thermoanaerobaculia bacterium]|nr:response regulator [Thermoanaerobaculia bacterium]